MTSARERLRQRMQESPAPGELILPPEGVADTTATRTDFLLNEILRVLKTTQRIAPSIDDENMVLDLTEFANETIAAHSDFSFLSPPLSQESGWIAQVAGIITSPEIIMVTRTREADLIMPLKLFLTAGTNQPQNIGLYLSQYDDITHTYGISWQPRPMIPHIGRLEVLLRNPTDRNVTLVVGYIERYFVTEEKRRLL